MTLEEYAKLAPGTRVYVEIRGTRMRGVSGNLLMADGMVPAIRFDDNDVAPVTGGNVHLVHLEPLN